MIDHAPPRSDRVTIYLPTRLVAELEARLAPGETMEELVERILSDKHGRDER